MVVAGLFLKANECRVVTLTGTRTEHQLLAPKLNKLALVKNPTQADVTEFIQSFKAYCLEHQVEQVVINRRATSGQARAELVLFFSKAYYSLLACCG